MSFDHYGKTERALGTMTESSLRSRTHRHTSSDKTLRLTSFFRERPVYVVLKS